MCVSAVEATFAGTAQCTLNGVPHPYRSGAGVHATWYQNQVNPGGPQQSGGNALMFAFPTTTVMDARNLIDIHGCTNIIKDIITAVRPKRRSASLGAKGPVSFGMDFLQVVEHGIYDVVLTNNPALIPDALERLVAPNKRPPIVDEVFRSFGDNYGKAFFSLCCFDNTESGEADPLGFWFEPARLDLLIAPALDAHDGRAPRLGTQVDVDHWVMFSSQELQLSQKGDPVSYQDSIPDSLRPFLPTRAIGRHYGGKMLNGDFVVPVSAVDQGNAFRDDQVRRDIIAV